MKLHAFAFVFVTSIASTAGAEPMERKGHYALQTLAVDGGSLLTAAVSQEPGVLFAGFLLGPPIVHLAHANPLHAGTSLVLRIVAPLVFAFAARAADGDGDESAMIWGAVGGGILASTIDAVLLARDPVQPQPPPQAAVLRFGGTF
jgi:hypothetical protein